MSTLATLATLDPDAPVDSGGHVVTLWLERVLRTAPSTAAEVSAEAAAKLLSASQVRWLLAVGVVAVVGWVATSLAAGFAGVATGVALLALGITGGLAFGARTALVIGALTSAAVGLGLLVGGASMGVLAGAGPTFAASLLVGETVALVLVLIGRVSLAAPSAIASIAATTGALAWTLEGSPLAASPWGIATGGALAVVVSLHARWGEGALAARHGPSQPWQAAHTRFAEAPRGILRVLSRFFSADDDLFSSPRA